MLLSHIKDPISGYDFFENYYCKKWTKNHPLSRNEYFWVYLKDSRKDILIEAKNLGLISETPWFKGKQCGITITNNYGNFKVQLCNLNKGKDININFIKNYIPKKWTSNLNISKEDFFWLKIKNKSDIANSSCNLLYNSLLEAKELGLVKYNSELSSDGKNIYIDIKCSYTNNWKTVLLQNINENVTIKYFLNFKKNYRPGFYNPFIMDYNKAIEFSKSKNFILEIKEIPVVLTENNISKTISEKSIVFDLYSKKYNKSIYVGECRCGILEFQSLLLYVKNDITETKKRRHIQYGYDINNQPVIDKIWNYDSNFIVRILAEGKEYSADSVKAYESIWNHECNNGDGCIIKQ